MTARRSALVIRALTFWFLLAAIASTAGVVRELWLVPRLGELAAHQVGTIVVTAAFLAAIAAFVRHFNLTPDEARWYGRRSRSWRCSTCWQ